MNAWLRGSVAGMLTVLGAARAPALSTYYWTGASDTNWLNTANWQGASNAPVGVTSETRLEVRNTSANKDLYYTAALGNTIFAGTNGNARSVMVGFGSATYRSALYVVGGTLEARGNAGGSGSADLIGGAGGTGRLIIDGGTYLRTNDVSGTDDGAEMSVGYSTTAGTIGELIVSNGLARIREIRLNLNNGAAVTGNVRAAGGTLEVQRITAGGTAGERNVYFNGGLVKPMESTSSWLTSLVVGRVQDGGARIDTAGFNAGIQCALLQEGSSTGGLTKTGAGVLTLSAGTLNTYVGDTVVSTGTLKIGADNSIPAGAGKGNVQLDANTWLDLGGFSQSVNGLRGSGTVDNLQGAGTYAFSVGSNDQTSTFSGVMQSTSGTVTFTKLGGGTLTLGGSNTYNGATTVEAGTLRLGAAQVLPDGGGKGSVTVSTGAVLDLGGFSETINGLGGAGVVDNTVGTGTNTLTLGNNNANAVFSGNLRNTSGTLAVTKTGGGTQTLSGSNSFIGVVTVSDGALRITDAHALGSIDRGTAVGNNARLELSGGIVVTGEYASISGSGGNNFGALQSVAGTNEWAGPVELLGTSVPRVGAAGGNLIISGAISGPHSLIVRSSDNNMTNSVEFRGVNTYTESTLLYNGLARLGAHNTLPVGGVLAFGINNFLQARLDMNGFDQQVSGLETNTNMTDSANIANQIITNTAAGTTSVLTVSNSAAYGFAGRLTDGAGAIALTKKGSGTLTLSGDNSLAGPTAVEAGTLRINGNHGGGGMITVYSGATLGGTGTVGAVTVNSGATLAPGASAGTLTATADMSLNGGSILQFELFGTAQGVDGGYDWLNLSGNALTVDSGARLDIQLGFAPAISNEFQLVSGLGGVAADFTDLATLTTLSDGDSLTRSFGGTNYEFRINYTGSDVRLTVIPEPGSAGLVGMVALVALLRRRLRA